MKKFINWLKKCFIKTPKSDMSVDIDDNVKRNINRIINELRRNWEYYSIFPDKEEEGEALQQLHENEYIKVSNNDSKLFYPTSKLKQLYTHGTFEAHQIYLERQRKKEERRKSAQIRRGKIALGVSITLAIVSIAFSGYQVHRAERREEVSEAEKKYIEIFQEHSNNQEMILNELKNAIRMQDTIQTKTGDNPDKNAPTFP